ncbi:hypothetical protein [Streptomyces sp. NPDC016845]
METVRAHCGLRTFSAAVDIDRAFYLGALTSGSATTATGASISARTCGL